MPDDCSSQEPEKSDNTKKFFVVAFREQVLPQVNDLMRHKDATLISFGVDGETVVHAETIFRYKGQAFSFRRLVWPPSHDAILQANIYVTVLQEKLMTFSPVAAKFENNLFVL